MGTDIYTYVEIRKSGAWHLVREAVFPPPSEYGDQKFCASPFDWRSYGMFGFLADVRNIARVPCIQKPAYELPADASLELSEIYRCDYPVNCITLKTLLDFDYGQTFENRRVTRDGDGGCTAEPGGGKTTTYRDFLGPNFFRDLEILRSMGSPEDVRVIMWFD